MTKTVKWVKLLSGVALGATLVMGTVACSSQNNDSSSQSSETTNSKSSSKSSPAKSSSSSSSTSSINESTAKKESSNIKVSQSEAVDKFNKKFVNSKIKSIDLQSNGSKYIYSIEGFDSSREHEMTIDAETGKELHSYSGHLEADERHESGLNLNKVISRTEAGKIAESHANGTAIEWKLEMDDGQPIWDVTVENGTHRTEIKINAETKHVLETEHDD